MPKNPSRSTPSGRTPARKPGSVSPKHRGYRPDEAPAKNRWSTSRRAEAQQGRPGDREADRGDRRPDWTPPEHRPTRGRVAGQRFGRPADGRSDRRDDRGGDRRYDERPARRGDDRGTSRYDERPQRRFEDRGERRFDERPARRSEDRGERRFDERSARRNDDRGTGRFDDRGDRRFDERPARRSDDRGTGRFDERPARRNDDRGDRRFDERPARRFEDRGERPAGRFEERGERRRFGGPREESHVRPHREPRETGDRERRYVEFQERNRGPRRDDRAPFGRPDRHMNEVDDVVHERLDAVAHTADEAEGVGFAELGLGANIVRALGELGATSPFPIQAATIPDVLAGRNVLGRGRTGSGKTIAFGAPLVERILQAGAGSKRAAGRAPKALILAPTRELALQIDDTVQPIARSVGLFTTQIYGGVPQARQVGALRRGVDIVIGTPGRVEDLVEQGHLDLGDVEMVVLDEADHMTDLGFLEPVQRILRETRPGGQRLLFSATLDAAVKALVDEFLADPAVHEVAGEDQASSTIEHRVLLIDQQDKIRFVTELASGPGKTLVFARTRAFAEQLAEELSDAGVPATSLHGDLNQAKRTRNLERLTSGRVNVLVATDVAARGIHVDDIGLVVQADAPEEYKTYLHRSGRTGRAGRQGTVVTLIARSRRRRLEELLQRAEIEPEVTVIPSGGDLPAELATA
ncbi:DEAD/DEAH box helicase [Naasia sp. SYSU D00057]|uniref:DEAD/DEAH box helicase n=1 Tax=Naasia sp. SYSU D00057 TaxID=2817380 RepID=UPI001B313435|nr:DEAD/DEAH box helicase [Naasia sp. SYSU D00057]